MTSDSSPLRSLLAQFFPSELLTPDVVSQIQAAAASGPDVDLDLQRAERCGFPEVVYGEGKPTELVQRIVRRQQAAGQPSLVTRVADETAAALKHEWPQAIHNESGRTIRVPLMGDSLDDIDRQACGHAIVVTAGSCDGPVAQEAIETLRWMRVSCELIQDVGVAGPHRLLRHVADLRAADAIVCVAGLEAALPSVVGGHVACPVIGVPVSVGYGASFAGVTALMSMLTCCASNVTVVNIDAGFKGGYLAGIIASRVGAARMSGRLAE
jgi:NCAIR mutase (PurE)-related protein